MVKERLFACYFCKTKSKKDYLIKVKTGKVTKSGQETIRFYHADCKIAEDNKKNKGFIKTGAYANESKFHNDGKELVIELLNSKVSIVDQSSKNIEFKGDFIAAESPVVKEFGNTVPFHGDTCVECFKKYDLLDYDENGVVNNQEALIRMTCHDKYMIIENQYKLHPCIKCPLNNLKFNMIFDIGIGNESGYTAAIEILNTSKIKDYKLKYCIDQNIDLFEVSVEELERYRNEQNTLVLNRIWWKDSKGNVQIHKSYNK